jgi:hypothetical protein
MRKVVSASPDRPAYAETTPASPSLPLTGCRLARFGITAHRGRRRHFR